MFITSGAWFFLPVLATVEVGDEATIALSNTMGVIVGKVIAQHQTNR